MFIYTKYTTGGASLAFDKDKLDRVINRNNLMESIADFRCYLCHVVYKMSADNIKLLSNHYNTTFM